MKKTTNIDRLTSRYLEKEAWLIQILVWEDDKQAFHLIYCVEQRCAIQLEVEYNPLHLPVLKPIPCQ
jgi:hypothetical protein